MKKIVLCAGVVLVLAFFAAGCDGGGNASPPRHRGGRR